jgi:ABC-type Fe3+-hydroxamate transport system substrate-binding protein
MALPRRSALILPLAAALPGRARAAMPPITDAIGRSVTLRAPPERIVITFNFEEFTAVAGPAGWDRVVGFNRRQWAVNRQSNWRRYQAAIPRLADLADVGASENNTFSVERVLGLRPDLLITLALDWTGLAPAMAQIEAAGVPILVVDYNAQVVARHVAGTLALGQATGNQDRAQALAELYTAQVADIARRVEGAARPRVYVELGQGGAGVIGNTYNDAMWGRMVQLAGGDNIAAGRIPAGFAPMSAEYVLAAAPEHVFITGSSWAGSPNAVQAGYDVDVATTRRTLGPYAERPGWSALPAIRSGELHAVETGLARSLWDWTATQYIARQLHPAALSDVDPVASLRRYHEQFLPVSFEGTWMARLTPGSS